MSGNAQLSLLSTAIDSGKKAIDALNDPEWKMRRGLDDARTHVANCLLDLEQLRTVMTPLQAKKKLKGGVDT